MSSSYQECIQNSIRLNLLAIDKPITMVDVGCNIEKIIEGPGRLDDFTETFLNLISPHNPVEVFAFEPVHYARFQEKYKNHSNVKLIKKALSDTRETKKFYVPGPSHGWSSFINRPVFHQVEAKGHQVQVLDVEATTIDEVFKGKTIDYLKIDTEGSELNILFGAKETLERNGIRFIQLEHGGTYQDAGYTMDDIHNLLLAHDFQLVLKNSTEMLWMHLGHQGWS